MHVASRPPLERIRVIDQAIRAGSWPNTRTLAAMLEVQPRTIGRDIAFMRDRLGAPITFDFRRNGYVYTEASYRLPLVQLTEGELIAIFLAERVLSQWRGTPFGPDLERAFQKIVAGLDDRITVDLGLSASAYSFRTTSEAPFDPAIFQDLVTAVLRQRRVVLDYYSASRDAATRREVDPYHLASVDGQWYLVGHCHLRGEVRMFAPSRIQSLELTDATFVPPDAFRIEDYLAGSLAVLRGDPGEMHRVRLRFTGDAVRYVRERTWHPSQIVELNHDGELILQLELSHLREVERWALSWGADCEVLEPETLRECVAAALQRAARSYDSRLP